MIRKNYIASSALLVCFLVPLFLSYPAKGQNSIWIQESEPMLDLEASGENSSQPYIGAYMTTDWIWHNPEYHSDVSAVRVTFHLPEQTNQSSKAITG
jgi:hypothetical protein